MSTRKVKGMSKKAMRVYASEAKKFNEKAEMAEARCTLYALKAGKFMMRIKKGNCRSKGSTWTEIMEDYFPHIDKKTERTYLNLAEHIKLDENKPLWLLGRDRLLKLVTIAKKRKKSLMFILISSRIRIPKDYNDIDRIRAFRQKVDDFIKCMSK